MRAVHIPYDLNGYHYPLNDYAFQALKQGRLPEWDPTIYCGMSFAANLQTQTFYPPMWLLYLANLHRAKLNYQTLEIFVFLHVWLTFVLSYIWLTRRGLLPMAAILGGRRIRVQRIHVHAATAPRLDSGLHMDATRVLEHR